MPYLIAGLLLVGALCLMNMALTFGIIRRIREYTKLLDALYEFVGTTRALPGDATGGPAVGDVVGEFYATTVDGTPVSRELLPNGTAVAFLSPDCRGCREQLPDIASWAQNQDPQRVLVVVDGRAGDPAAMVSALKSVAQVVVDDPKAPVSDAFRVQSYPIFCAVADGGRLTAVAPRISRLPAGSLA